MRTKKALLNVGFNTITQILNIIIMLVMRRTFSNILGDDILGLNSVYSSIVSFLTLSELGLSSAVAVALYKPLAEGDEKKTVAHMHFMKRAYVIVGISIIMLGTFLIPALGLIIKDDYEQYYLATSFELYVFATGLSYFWSYKRTLFEANQEAYIISASDGIYKIIVGVGQILALYFTESFHIYILVFLLGNVIENMMLSLLCDYRYPFLKKYKNEYLNSKNVDFIKDKISGNLCYNISNYIIQGADNIIISSFLSTTLVAYYNNFTLITNILYSMFVNIAVSATAGLGNIAYTERRKLMLISKKLIMVMQFAFSFSATGFFVLSPFFVKCIFPSSSMMPLSVLALMTLIHFIRGTAGALEAIRTSVGNYWDRYINIVIAVLNVFLSVIFVKYMGLGGVLVGTLLCYILKCVIILPYIVFTKIFNNGEGQYFLRLIRNTFFNTAIMASFYIFTNYIQIDSWQKWFSLGISIFVVTFAINILLYKNSIEYKEMKQYVLGSFMK